MIIKKKMNFIDGASFALYELMNNDFLIINPTYKSFYKNKKALNNNYFLIFRDPNISCTKKKQLIDAFLDKSDFHPIVKQFMLYLLSINKLFYFPKIISNFLILSEKKIKETSGLLYVGKPLEKRLVQKIEVFFSNKLKRKVSFIVVINPQIQNGLILEIDNKSYNYSLDGRLNKFRKSILQKR